MLAMEETSPRGDLLIIILDCNPFWWGKSVAATATDFGSFAPSAPVSGNNEISDILSHCLNSVLALANAHLLFDADNEVAILASYNNHTKFLRYVLDSSVVGNSGDKKRATKHCIPNLSAFVCPFLVIVNQLPLRGCPNKLMASRRRLQQQHP